MSFFFILFSSRGWLPYKPTFSAWFPCLKPPFPTWLLHPPALPFLLEGCGKVIRPPRTISFTSEGEWRRGPDHLEDVTFVQTAWWARFSQLARVLMKKKGKHFSPPTRFRLINPASSCTLTITCRQILKTTMKVLDEKFLNLVLKYENSRLMFHK
jgi:hypothetical protein